MLDKYGRIYMTRIMNPIARVFLRARISPDAVTIGGTLGVCVGALAFFPRGELLWGTLFIAAFAFADNLDGAMARLQGRESKWGAFLDSVLDRVGDAAIFAGLALWYAGRGDDLRVTALLLAVLALGQIVSYVRAKAESLGFTAKGGVAERAERLVLILLATGWGGLLDLPILIEIVLWLLVAGSAWTIVHRARQVHTQAAAPV